MTARPPDSSKPPFETTAGGHSTGPQSPGASLGESPGSPASLAESPGSPASLAEPHGSPARATSAPSPAMSTTAKGRTAEERAESFLRARGYEIVERNARSIIGEIDLVAREGGDLVFVEVRSRADASTGGAEETVGARKQRQVARAAEAYLAERAPSFDTCRFDVVAITGDDIALFQDAFRVNGDPAARR